MKKNTAKVFVCLFIISVAAALEITVPEFYIGLHGAKYPGMSGVSFYQESAIKFRLLQGKRFYSDFDTALNIPNPAGFFHPDKDIRSLGEFSFFNFSLNFPHMSGRPLSFAIFTGVHPSLTGQQQSFDLLKHGTMPVRMADSDISSCFLPPLVRENIGLSLSGLIANSGYLGASFGWNAKTSAAQEYGLYLQTGLFANTVIFNTFAAAHTTGTAEKVSVSADASFLFPIQDYFSLYLGTGLSKTDVRDPAVQHTLLSNTYVFFEPRLRFAHADIDVTFFVSSIKMTNRTGVFPSRLLTPFSYRNNDLYAGCNIFAAVGYPDIERLQGGCHLLTAINIYDAKNSSSLVCAVTPFFAVYLGPCSIDLRATVFPLAYTQPESMVEGKISIKRDL